MVQVWVIRNLRTGQYWNGMQWAPFDTHYFSTDQENAKTTVQYNALHLNNYLIEPIYI